ncbi:GNAT family N-acetyltransferase [Agrobacterium vitis]|uniref:N-acetyltransferase n=1 Tax=Agrobacterium vitis TaxID=373 RepID=A0A368P1B3_AGRVI|nr:GNAT family N-acetyltransferase [Agrobacterium vitis]KAA3519740.1 N-acetyltransferase [Agrobacterium vitis]KAA3532046.1 N-acetyltransferase [Agrobacterium vitis]MCF1475903.1 GNAT family N-acetyltransferase [Agrobacterium vitis]MUZ97039.1 GNAT family N-acetyltransferase [Agrobacterium vitis]MVA29213.1 GNAT family N-acetyltransferase [Agrobacterium vitis]
MRPALTLAPLARDDRALHLSLPLEQQIFAGPIENVIDDNDQTVDFHIGSVSDDPICFFKIDRDYHARLSGFDLAEHGFQPGDLGLRALIVGSQFQGKGYGTAAMAALPAYLARHYPARHCFLTVNLRNPAAISLYTKSGWQDTGQTYLGGKAGPQILMRLEL